MSLPRLVLCGLDPGPAVALAAGALCSGLDDGQGVRPISLGLDLPLWRLLYRAASRAARILDPELVTGQSMDELADHWSAAGGLELFVAVRPALDSWQGRRGSRAVDLAVHFDAPLLVVVDARAGVTSAAGLVGLRRLAGDLQWAGAILIEGAAQEAAEAAAIVTEEAGVPLAGRIPAELADEFARVYAGGARGDADALSDQVRLCREAAAGLDAESLRAAATTRGFMAPPVRRLLVPAAAAAGLRLAVAGGGPLEPLALEDLDLLQAMDLELVPMDLARDDDLPDGCSGLYLAGGLDEAGLPAFAANRPLLEALAAALYDGLPTLAMGAGTLLLLRRLIDGRGRAHDLVGVLTAEAEVAEIRDRPRYLTARAAQGNPFDEGEAELCEVFDLAFVELEREACAYQLDDPRPATEGFAARHLMATTLFVSLVARPAVAASFVEAMRVAAVPS